jgi:hypothetical protein
MQTQDAGPLALIVSTKTEKLLTHEYILNETKIMLDLTVAEASCLLQAIAGKTLDWHGSIRLRFGNVAAEKCVLRDLA